MQSCNIVVETELKPSYKVDTTMKQSRYKVVTKLVDTKLVTSLYKVEKTCCNFVSKLYQRCYEVDTKLMRS
jgi:hypothetical protein